MKFRNLRVGPRLGLGFGAILLITALLALTGIWRIGALKDASERVATREIELRTLVDDWTADVRLNWVRTEAFLKAIDPGYMEKLTTDTQATYTASETKAQRIEELLQSDQGKSLLAGIAAARTAYSTKLTEIRELHRGGEPSVPTMVDNDLRPLADKYLQTLDGLRNFMAAQLAESQRSTNTLASASRMLLGVGAAVAVALGALLAVLVTRSIVLPMQQGRKAAECIADGDLTQPLDTSAGDEAGQLLQALATMQGKLATIVSNVRRNAEGVANASSEIAQGNNDLSGPHRATGQRAGANLGLHGATGLRRAAGTPTTPARPEPTGRRRLHRGRSGRRRGGPGGADHEGHQRQQPEDRGHHQRHRWHCLSDQHPGAQCGRRSGAGGRTGPGFCRGGQ